MMRGAHHWAVAVRRPAGDIHLESHDIDSVADRHPILRKPLLRGVIVLGQSLAIGMRALMVAANQSVEDDEQLTSRQVGVSLAIAMVLFVGRLHPGTDDACSPGSRTGSGGGVPLLIGRGRVPGGAVRRLPVAHRPDQGHPPRLRVPRRRAQDDRRLRARRRARRPTRSTVPQGARALRHELPDHRDDHHDLRVHALRHPRLLWRMLSRIVAIPIIAGIAYEALRLGARFPDSLRDAGPHGARASGCRRSPPRSPTTPRSRWRSPRSTRCCVERATRPAPPGDRPRPADTGSASVVASGRPRPQDAGSASHGGEPIGSARGRPRSSAGGAIRDVHG